MWNIMIEYAGGSIEFYDAVPDEQLASQMVREMEEHDRAMAARGVPIINCRYFAEKEKKRG